MILEACASNIKFAANSLLAGELVGLPTETVYGLAANALDAEAVQRIFELKGRPTHNPLIVHIADFASIRSVANIPAQGPIADWLEKLKVFWPGPLSVVLPKSERIPDNVTAGSNSVAVRIPDHPVALELLVSCKLPLAAPSANKSNYISPTSAAHVLEEFGEKLACILDGGKCNVGLESTVLSLIHQQPTLLRPGAISKEQLSRALGVEIFEYKSQNAENAKVLLSPGMLSKHYSPHTPLILAGDLKNAASLSGKRAGYISFNQRSPLISPERFTKVSFLSHSGDLNEAARNLFHTLREHDRANLELIVIENCQESGIGNAIMNRVLRALKRDVSFLQQ